MTMIGELDFASVERIRLQCGWQAGTEKYPI